MAFGMEEIGVFESTEQLLLTTKMMRKSWVRAELENETITSVLNSIAASPS